MFPCHNLITQLNKLSSESPHSSLQLALVTMNLTFPFHPLQLLSDQGSNVAHARVGRVEQLKRPNGKRMRILGALTDLGFFRLSAIGANLHVLLPVGFMPPHSRSGLNYCL